MNIVSENLPENVRSCWADLHGCLTQWHVHIRSKSPFISDHTLFRTLSGLMFYMPDEELESTEDFQQFVASEMLQVFICYCFEWVMALHGTAPHCAVRRYRVVPRHDPS